jgi:hypothetical protein
MQKVRRSDFNEPPAYGVAFAGENEIMRQAGIKKGDVVVALNGIRVFDTFQYDYVRDLRADSRLQFILWDGIDYVERSASPPNRRFGVSIEKFVNAPAR